MRRYWFEIDWEEYPWQKDPDVIVIDGDWRPRRIGCTAWDLADAARMVEERFDELRRGELMRKSDHPLTVRIVVNIDVSTLRIEELRDPPSNRGVWYSA